MGEQFEWVVVGGGIHGTYVARELLEAGVSREELAIVDDHGELLASFREKARACGMETLRSNYVQHIGPSPFGLETFASARDRDDELVPTQNSQRRPTLDLFLSYAEYVIDQFDLRELVREARLTGLSREETLRLETTAGDLQARRVVLAIGPGEECRQPTWMSDDSRVESVWERSVRPEKRVGTDEHVVVVGGGITAGQTATALSDQAEQVTLWSRRPLREALREADPRWLNWDHIERELHALPPGSSERFERVKTARNDGTVPPYLRREIAKRESVSLRSEPVTEVYPAEAGLLVAGTDTTLDGVDRILLATGFDPVYDRPVVERVAKSLSLARGHRGLPILDDETLAWMTSDGEPSNVFVTGKLAEGTVGPYAGNIPGARRAAERLVETVNPPLTA